MVCTLLIPIAVHVNVWLIFWCCISTHRMIINEKMNSSNLQQLNLALTHSPLTFYCDPHATQQRHPIERASWNRCNVVRRQRHQRWTHSPLFGTYPTIWSLCCRLQSLILSLYPQRVILCWRCDGHRYYRVCTRLIHLGWREKFVSFRLILGCDYEKLFTNGPCN